MPKTDVAQGPVDVPVRQWRRPDDAPTRSDCAMTYCDKDGTFWSGSVWVLWKGSVAFGMATHLEGVTTVMPSVANGFMRRDEVTAWHPMHAPLPPNAPVSRRETAADEGEAGSRSA